MRRGVHEGRVPSCSPRERTTLRHVGLGAVRCAAALALAAVLAFAAVVARFASALAFTVVLALTAVLGGVLIVGLEVHSRADLRACAHAGLSIGSWLSIEAGRGATEQTGYSRSQNESLDAIVHREKPSFVEILKMCRPRVIPSG